jgi:pyruvate-formate lyase-activating enzyme
MRERPNPFTPAALAAEVESLAASAPSLHAIAVTGGEPLLQADFVGDWLDARVGPPVLLETAGILPARLRRLLPRVAIVSLDVKLPSNTGERPRWEEHEECLGAAVAAGTEVYVKMPVDETTVPEEVERGAQLVARIAPQIPLFVMPLSDPGTGRLAVGAATLAHLHTVASRQHGDVRLGFQLHKVLGIL